MNDRFQLFAADFDQWRQDGISPAEEDALALALFRWWRRRPQPEALTVTAKCLYSTTVGRWTATEAQHENKVRAGRIGGLRTQARNRNAKAPALTRVLPSLEAEALKPTSPSSTTSTALLCTKEVSTSQARNFKKPTVEEVSAYCTAQKYINFDAERFVDYYESIGWRVGRSPMRDWKAAVRNWMRIKKIIPQHIENNNPSPSVVLRQPLTPKPEDYV